MADYQKPLKTVYEWWCDYEFKSDNKELNKHLKKNAFAVMYNDTLLINAWIYRVAAGYARGFRMTDGRIILKYFPKGNPYYTGVGLMGGLMGGLATVAMNAPKAHLNVCYLIAPGERYSKVVDKKHFDRWRTSAAELVIGRFSIGTYVTTNWGKHESELIDNYNSRYDGEDPLLGYNTDRYMNDPKAKAWIEGNIYSAPFWIGYNHNGNVYRIGYSHQYVQSLTQNAVHKYLVKTPFFLGTDNFYKGMFSYSGYNNPLSLW